jgi:mono/diheme cytochrome c family protein
MFKDYCAACHGPDAKGSGPAVDFLKTPPPDLTTMAKRNHGKFPAQDFVAVLNFGTKSHAHGTVDMPLWGDLFRSRGGSGLAGVRVAGLSSYVESLQEK